MTDRRSTALHSLGRCGYTLCCYTYCHQKHHYEYSGPRHRPGAATARTPIAEAIGIGTYCLSTQGTNSSDTSTESRVIVPSALSLSTFLRTAAPAARECLRGCALMGSPLRRCLPHLRRDWAHPAHAKAVASTAGDCSRGRFGHPRAGGRQGASRKRLRRESVRPPARPP